MVPSPKVRTTWKYDYQDNIFQNAFGTDNYLSVKGGTDKSNYYASFGYANNDGIILNTNFKKYTGRLRLNQTLSSWATLSAGLGYTLSKSQDMPNGNNFFSPISTMFIIDNVWNITERSADGTLKQVELVRMYDGEFLGTNSNGSGKRRRLLIGQAPCF